MAASLQDDAQTAQEVLSRASKKLNDAIKEVGSPNDFAILLQELLQVSTKIAQFDEMTSAAEEEASSEEAQTWKEISMMTLQHCRTQLVDRQRLLIEKLQGLSETGASLHTSPAPLTLTTDAKTAQEVKVSQVGHPPGLVLPPAFAPSSESKAKNSSRSVGAAWPEPSFRHHEGGSTSRLPTRRSKAKGRETKEGYISESQKEDKAKWI